MTSASIHSTSIPTTMLALTQTAWGEPAKVLKLQNVSTPQPSATQLLVNVRASAVNPVDWKLMSGQMKYFLPRKFPFIPLFDCAGVVVAKGEKCDSRFKVGDKVFGDLDVMNGAGGEYVATEQVYLAHKPNSISFEESASIPLAGLTAYQGLVKHAQFKSGQKVVVIGASGGVGLFAVQFAKALGAQHVVGVCSEQNAALVKSLGADQVIDYKKDKYGSALKGQNYDLVFDCAGGAEQWHQCRAVLKNGGKFVTIVTDTTQPSGVTGTASLITRILWRKTRSFLPPYHAYIPVLTCAKAPQDLEVIANWVDEGKVKAVVEKVYEMEEYEEMFKRSMSHRARGKLVYKVIPSKETSEPERK